MASTTPRSALPYPALTDVPNVPSDVQALATQLDGQTTVLLYENTFGIAPPSGSYTISNIPQTCRDLRIEMMLKDTQTVTNTFVAWCFQFNGDTTSTYFYQRTGSGNFTGAPSSVGGGPFTNTAAGALAATSNTGATVLAGNYATSICTIMNYTSTTQYKVGQFTNFTIPSAATSQNEFGGFLWLGAVGITSITLIPNGGVGLAANSVVRILGIG